MTDRYDLILEENANLKRALASSKSIIERTANDYDTLKQIHEEFKLQGEKMKKENEELHIKNISLINEKKELENQFDTTIRNLKIAIEQKQREIEEVQAKIIPSFDHDMLRIKIINELEIPHKQLIDQKVEDIEKLQEQLYNSNRQIEILNSKIELIHTQYDRDIKTMRDRYQLEISDLMNEVSTLNEKVDDTKDKEALRKAKKDHEECKQRLLSREQEAEELRIEKDKLRDEKNDTLIKFSKLIDQERNEKRLYKGESEKLNIRARYLEEEVKKSKIKIDSMINDIEIAGREKDNLQEEIRKKDDMIHQLQRRITELENENVQTETKCHENSMKVYNEEHEKFIEERNKNIYIQRELETIKKSYNQTMEDQEQIKNRLIKEINTLKSDNQQVMEERDKLKIKMSQLVKENEEFELNANRRETLVSEQERELDNIKKKFRDSLQRIQQLDHQIDELNIKLKISDSKAAGEDILKLQQKNKRLREKLQLANEKIATLLKIQYNTQSQKPLQSTDTNLQLQQQQPIQQKKLQEEDFNLINQIKMNTQGKFK